MQVPDSLSEKMELFRRAGRVTRYTQGLFLEPSWLAVYLGQGIVPRTWDQRANPMSSAALNDALDRLRTRISAAVSKMPIHAEAMDPHP